MVKCITCGESLKIDGNIELNEIIVCDSCGTELEIVNLKPIEITEAPKEEEDWGE